MKTIFTYPIILLFCIVNILSLQTTYSQNEETKKLLAEIEGKWQKDDNGNVTYTKVIENINLPKDSIYNRVLEYFDFHDMEVNKNKEEGEITVKNLRHKHNSFGRMTLRDAITDERPEYQEEPFDFFEPGIYDFSEPGVYDIKIKFIDNGVKISITLTNYFLWRFGKPRKSLLNISSTYPLNPKGRKKDEFGKLFYESNKRMQQNLLAIEASIITGNNYKEFKNFKEDSNVFVKKDFYSNGNLFSIMFCKKGGWPIGECRGYYKNGQLMLIGSFTDKTFEKKIGEWKVYFENGQLKEIRNYSEKEGYGRKSGEWKGYYENGQLKYIGNYSDKGYNRKTGEWKEYFKNGKLKSVVNWLDDKKTGEWKEYYEGGQLKFVGNYLKNKPSGEWKYYDETGKLIKTENHN